MADLGKFDEYEANEKDLDSILNYLRIFDPENANPEQAVDFLVYLRTGAHVMAKGASDEELKNLYQKYKKKDVDK
jgi:hypothetical protein